MRNTFLGLITAFAIALAACGDDGTGSTTAAVIGDVPGVPPAATEIVLPPPAPAPPAETGQPNTQPPSTVPLPDPPCTHCPFGGGAIITPSR